MSSVCVLTPIVIGSWPMIASAVAGAASSMGFTLATSGIDLPEPTVADEKVTTTVQNSEVIAESLSRGEKVTIVRDGVRIEVGVDDRGQCSVCAQGPLSKGQLKRIGEEVAGRIVQQFTYHKLVTELKGHGFEIAEESMQQDSSIHMRVIQR